MRWRSEMLADGNNSKQCCSARFLHHTSKYSIGKHMSAADRDEATLQVIQEMKRLYKAKILRLEQHYRYDHFYSPIMTDAEFDSKPHVLLIGQYSVGKTSFIRYLLGRDFPGQRISPEPTTDKFTAVMDGPEERIIQGGSLTVSHELPCTSHMLVACQYLHLHSHLDRALEKFGIAFLNHLEGVTLPSPVLENITFVDTPGVLSGDKQRGYNFCEVISWFAMRSDLILLLFDAHKLDISDELRNVIDSLKGNDDKIRCILNKADQVDGQTLMRMYGALMWSMGKVIKTPEVLRVYIGSFWDQPLMYDDNARLFEMEEKDLMRDLRDLPRNSTVRKINELVKRVRMGKVHAYIIGHLKDQMPMFWGHAKKQKELLADLPSVFGTVMKKYNLAPGDFPNLAEFKSKVAAMDFTTFKSLCPEKIDEAEAVLGTDFPKLMKALSKADANESGEVEPSPIGFAVPASISPTAMSEDGVVHYVIVVKIMLFLLFLLSPLLFTQFHETIRHSFDALMSPSDTAIPF